MQSFYMPPGYRIELVASEPLIQEPVALDWDVDGRLWAVEMPGFMADLTGSNEHEPIGRVVVLEDTDRDGRMDKRTVFADRLVLARSIKVLDRGVLVAEPPNLWLMKDTTGDLKMDSKELVTSQFGRFEGDPQNNANGFVWALDNRLYTAGQADVQLRLKNGAFEVTRTLQRGEWGITQDDAGRIYRNTNESAVHVDLVPTAYYARNPNLVRTRGSYERLATGNEDLNIVWPVRPNPGTNRAYQAGIDRADGTLAKFTSVCGPLVYRGDRLPAERLRKRVRRRACRQPGVALDRRRRRPGHGRAQSVSPRRVPGLHRRTLPSSLHHQCARRDDVHRRHVSRDHRASHLGHRVPARSDPRAPAQSGHRIRPDLPRRPRIDARAICGRRSHRRAPRTPSWSRRCRTRTAGGATPRSG